MVDERLAREDLLRRSADYQRCYRRGRRHQAALASLHHQRNGLPHPRLGITASRKVGKAVVRNRLKRRVREIYRRWNRRSELPPLDLVVHLKPAAAGADFASLEAQILGLLERAVEGRRR